MCLYVDTTCILFKIISKSFCSLHRTITKVNSVWILVFSVWLEYMSDPGFPSLLIGFVLSLILIDNWLEHRDWCNCIKLLCLLSVLTWVTGFRQKIKIIQSQTFIVKMPVNNLWQQPSEVDQETSRLLKWKLTVYFGPITVSSRFG